ncbi:MAG: RagB/SusD family nutrient uptake outer membrane protein [Candidatus Symbiothrix sp.]|jgi:hypothetical protein|nr:RagB/SusD family nutrient uptake outer membrane protein [Candidatus Symbiothrix sp.]
MKQIKTTIILGFVLTGLVSCSDFLDKELQGSPNPDNYYRTTYQLQEALNAVYDILQSNNYTNCEWIFGEACGDDVTGNDESTVNQISQLVNFDFNTSNNWIRDRYSINYQGINRANQVIANAYKVRLASEDINGYVTVREILAQAKFLRAMFYFNLVKTYGDVPIRPEVEDINDLAVPRSSKEEVYACIEKDLREAAIMLRSKFTDKNVGKAGCGAVVALLIKVLAYQAVPGENSDKWEEMAGLGEYFIEGKTLTYGEILHFEKYEESWDELRSRLWFKPKEKLASTDPYETPDTPLPQLANEYSLEAKNSYDGALLHYRELYYQRGEFCSRSVFEIVFKESANGMSDDLNEGTGIFQDLFVSRMHASASFLNEINNDPRKDDVVKANNTVAFDGERLAFDNLKTGCMKWYTPKVERPTDENDNGKNRRVIIYSEVVLWYAEALNETGNRVKCLEQLNNVKRVANKINNTSALYKGGTYLEMREQIWKERRIELCHLWDRFFDIVRQGRAASVLHAFATETIHNRGSHFVEGINEIFPIPQNEVDITNGVVTQNPGY